MLALKITIIIIGSTVAIPLTYVMFLGVCALLVDTKKEYSHVSKFYYYVLMSATYLAVFATGVRIKTTGLERVPKGRFLLVGNHRSSYDPILEWYALRRSGNFAFVSKAGNFKIPFFGRIIRKCSFLQIDRNDPKQSMKTLIKAAELIKNDEASVGIYPEGKRNAHWDEGLLPFHNGVFKIAQIGDAPIVVVTIRGSEDIINNYFRRRTNIYIDVVDVINADEIKKVKTSEIGERVLLAMSRTIPSQVLNLTDNSEEVK